MGVFHSVGAVLVNYIMLLVCGGSMHSVIISFVLNMGYLVTGINITSDYNFNLLSNYAQHSFINS